MKFEVENMPRIWSHALSYLFIKQKKCICSHVVLQDNEIRLFPIKNFYTHSHTSDSKGYEMEKGLFTHAIIFDENILVGYMLHNRLS